jgi:translation initiation factor eIF-2B subunit gamma
MQQTYVTNQPLPQIIFKQTKQTVEADHDMTGSTAKLQIPKARLCHGQELVIRTEWSDVHVYSLAPWVRQLIRSRRNLSSLQEDLLPLLVARQHRGKRATFGKAGLEALAELNKENQQEENSNTGDNSSSSLAGGDSSINNDPQGDDSYQHDALDDKPYSVQALLLPSKSAVRANTIPAYLFACKEAVAVATPSMLPEGCRWNGKFQTLTLEGTTLGAKINMKSSTVGKHCRLGDKCRLHNVVIMDGASIGEGCSLQNTIVGHGAQIGNNCSLNDCQVGPGMVLPPSTKEKGESFMVGDVMDSDDILL